MVTPAMGGAMIGPMYSLRGNGAQHGGCGFHLRLSTLYNQRLCRDHTISGALEIFGVLIADALFQGTYYTICSLTFLLSSERNLDLWPVLVNAGYSEKQSIINIRRHIQGLFVRDWTLSIAEQVNQELDNLQRNFLGQYVGDRILYLEEQVGETVVHFSLRIAYVV